MNIHHLSLFNLLDFNWSSEAAYPGQCIIPVWKFCKGVTGLLTTRPANR